ncbi:alpha/beta fold hydrolase [Thermus thermamylovorans]|uniref:Alpha/beta fold hydrolase n=1 Tax=Thermus thermamylovorans TaxID=2509362 RepID=A0A4Q9B7K6_9DEIN|nr:alpha/beta hydrolase [Thermus thermamylovorans]TBH21531.1 alpha/beta fold hydrolase [Thermus thermamylovorans]
MARLRFRVEGEGPKVVLLNGIFQRLESWDPVVPLLGDYTLLRYDMRGQGESEAPEGPYTPEAHAQDLLSLLGELGWEEAALVGLSNGGIVGLQAALMAPKRFRGLVLCCTTPYLDAALRAKVQSWLHALKAGGTPLRLRVALPWVFGARFLNAHPELLREEGLGPLMAQAPDEKAQERLLFGFLSLEDLRPYLRGLTLPALVLYGEEDVLFPKPYAQALAEALGARLQALPTGHAAPLEAPSAFAQAVRGFLEEVYA